MKIIVVHIGDILKYPPVYSLINAFERLKIETVVITTMSKITDIDYKHVKFKVLPYKYENIGGPIKKLINIFKTKPVLSKVIDSEYDNDSVVWITYNVSLKHLNLRKIYNYKYVLQLMELCEHLKLHEKLPFHFNESKLANNAIAVVVPEYNRALITKAWWNLKQTPYIIPNKPYYDIEISKNSYIRDDKARVIIDKLKDKKIILYQGILTRERPIEKFIYAINRLGDDYAFVVMSGGENIYANIESDNYYFIPFVEPPYHLEITSHAYIGILTYIPVESEFSKLNVLFCAPNKTFEYGMFGVPMIGNDLPGLNYLFNTEICGTCFKEFTEEDIIDAIKKVENNYEEMSFNSRKYYDSVDYDSYINKLFNKIDQTRLY